MNDAVDWNADLGGGTRVALDPGRDVPLRRRGALRTGPATHVGQARDRRARPRAPPPPGAQLPARSRRRRGACWSRPASASGSTRRPAPCASTRGRPSCPRSRRPGSCPETVDVVALSHLHFDHAGGLLRGRRRAGLPARDDRRPEGRVGGRARRQPAPGRLVRAARAASSSRAGASRAGPTARRSCCPA